MAGTVRGLDRSGSSGWVPTAHSGSLSGRRNKNTLPEMALRRAIHRLGLRFRLHVRLVKGCTPDILLPRHRVAIFVDGDYWHGCPQHGRKTPFTGPNASLWDEKMRRNRERDERSTRLAEESGYRVLRLWECEVKANAAAAAEKVREACEARRR